MMTGWLQCFASRLCAFSAAWRRKHTALERLQVAQCGLNGDICMQHMYIGNGSALWDRGGMYVSRSKTGRLKSPHEDLYNPPSSKASRDEPLPEVEDSDPFSPQPLS